MADPASRLRDKLFEYERIIYDGIKDGNVLSLLASQSRQILATFETSSDPTLAPVFDEYPMIHNFIISWTTEGRDPTFVKDWQEALRMGQIQRYRRAVPPDAAPLATATSDQPFTRSPQPRELAARPTTTLDARDPPPTTTPDATDDSDRPLAAIIRRRAQTLAANRLQPRAGSSRHRSAPPPALENPSNTTTKRSALAPTLTSKSRCRVTLHEPVVDPSESDESPFPFKLDVQSKMKRKAKPLPSDAEMSATDGETLGKKKYHRRQPKANGNIYNPPCGHCQRRSLQCLEDEYGGACVPCKKRKTACTHSGLKRKRPPRKAGVTSDAEREQQEPAKKKRRRTGKKIDTDAECCVKPELDVTKRRRRMRKNIDADVEGRVKADHVQRTMAETAPTTHQDDPPSELEYIDEQEALAPSAPPVDNLACRQEPVPSAPQDTEDIDAVEDRMRQRLNAMESYFNHQVNVQAQRFDVERQRMRHLENMVHRVGDQLGGILTRAGTRMTAHEVNAAERLERLERLVARLVDTVGEVCDHLGLEADTLHRLQFHPSVERRQANATWFGTHWPVHNMDEFLDRAATEQTPPVAAPIRAPAPVASQSTTLDGESTRSLSQPISQDGDTAP